MQYLTPAEIVALNSYVDNWTCTTDCGVVLQLEEVGSSDFLQFVEELFGSQRLAQLAPDAYSAWVDQ